jgi:hypothetical protein
LSKKNLARTAIEGGRASYCRFEEQEGTCRERRAVRDGLRKVCVDPELGDDITFEARELPYDKEFDDKLSPVKAWLLKQRGRHWDDIYSELRRRFDSRTTAGRHILYDHLLQMVGRWSDHDAHINDLLICEDGVLRTGPYQRRRYRPKKNPEPVRPFKQPTLKRIAKIFVGGRRVHADYMIWYVPTRVRIAEWKPCEGTFCRHPDWPHKDDEHKLSWLKNGREVRTTHLKRYWYYRQDRDLTAKEIAFVNTLTWDTRSQHTYREDEHHEAKRYFQKDAIYL